MGIKSKISVALIFTVLIMCVVLTVTMLYDSERSIVGEIEPFIVEPFMIEVEEVLYFDGEYDVCVLITSPIEFQDLDMIFDYVRIMCHYGDYLMFENHGVLYITNSEYTIIEDDIDDITARLGGVL